MKAMILAAGLGTRLKPITDKIPKALVEVGGVPMLERVILTLKRQGFSYIVVNVHHFADQIIDFLRVGDFGVEVVVSDESGSLLDTGGGIVKAAPLLFGPDSSPVLIHNVDIISNADLQALMREASDTPTLLVSRRDSSRKLIFDKEMRLIGWHDLKTDTFRPSYIQSLMTQNPHIAHTTLKNLTDPIDLKDDLDLKDDIDLTDDIDLKDLTELAFSGIYAVTQSMVQEMKSLEGEGKYSVMDYFLNPKREVTIKGLLDNDLKLLDIGKPATLSQASDFI